MGEGIGGVVSGVIVGSVGFGPLSAIGAALFWGARPGPPATVPPVAQQAA